jgi:hypothetical protein
MNGKFNQQFSFFFLFVFFVFFKTKFIFFFGMLGRISTIIEIIVNCIVCEREIGILASSLAMGLG